MARFTAGYERDGVAHKIIYLSEFFGIDRIIFNITNRKVL